VEPGESADAALRREIREELGVGLSITGSPSLYEAAIGSKAFVFLVFPSRFESLDFHFAAHDGWAYYSASEIEGLALAPLDGPALRDWALRSMV
jgi:8-oxo-dGTP pyrophosphatase MutT (NUDIX family)